MTNDPSFVPAIATALQSPTVRSSLFRVLAALGQSEVIEKAGDVTRAFDAFMAEVGCAFARDRLEDLDASFKADLCLWLHRQAANIPAEERQAALEILGRDPDWAGTIQALGSNEHWRLGGFLGIKLFLNEEVVANLELSDDRPVVSVADITPGWYALELDTGLCIWERRVADRDVRWTEAYGRAPFKVAAASGIASEQPTIDETVADGTLHMRVFPGLEHGRLEIEWGQNGRTSP